MSTCFRNISDKLLIRVDADSNIGSGHIMRCIALAQGWIARGGTAIVISKDLSNSMRHELDNREIGYRTISSDNDEYSEPNIVLQMTKKLRKSTDRRIWIVLDGYHFDANYQMSLASNFLNVMVIDDINHLEKYTANIVVNQNPYATKMSYNTSDTCKCLLGTDYVLLRDEFKTKYDLEMSLDGVLKVMVSCGGSDPHDITSKILEALKSISIFKKISVKVVLGPNNPNSDLIVQKYNGWANDFVEYQCILDASMVNIMAWADMAITTAGTTCWELAYCGVPSIITAWADNQLELAKSLNDVNAACYLGWYDEIDETKIKNAIKRVALNDQYRQDLIENASRMIDGKGVDRVIDNMLIYRKTQ